MRRALASLKYLPAVLCGLLVAAWVASWGWNPEISCPLPTTSEPERSILVALQQSTVQVIYSRSLFRFRDWITSKSARSNLLGFYQTHLIHDGDNGSIVQAFVSLPIPVLLTAMLPIAVGPFTRFRFPLWTWFAWTAPIAVEVAFYVVPPMDAW